MHKQESCKRRSGEKLWMALGAGSFKEIKLWLCHRLCRAQPKVVKFCIIDHRDAPKVRSTRSILVYAFRMHNSTLHLPPSATPSTYLPNSFAEVVPRDQWEARRMEALSLLQQTQRVFCGTVEWFFFTRWFHFLRAFPQISMNHLARAQFVLIVLRSRQRIFWCIQRQQLDLFCLRNASQCKMRARKQKIESNRENNVSQSKIE